MTDTERITALEQQIADLKSALRHHLPQPTLPVVASPSVTAPAITKFAPEPPRTQQPSRTIGNQLITRPARDSDRFPMAG